MFSSEVPLQTTQQDHNQHDGADGHVGAMEAG